jgi:hypothetical protein
MGVVAREEKIGEKEETGLGGKRERESRVINGRDGE